ncbi:MAG: murein L,D-transpeptidase catalytic domain family protein [Sphingomonadaceae bacterium]|nr:murein L,D-transpeptidase catalytic domain family protein [Sphingomonadaceae bacterium]
MRLSRREFVYGGLAALALAKAAPASLSALEFAVPSPEPRVEPENPLIHRALAALDRHAGAIAHRDMFAVADFARPSREPRFFLCDAQGRVLGAHLVAHGSGSDPAHSGWLQHFSNENGSYATSSGAYVTGELYEGQYGEAMRLDGLDPENANARARAIVVHTAWYAQPELIAQTGKLGRSQGCFTLPRASIAEVLSRLGPGRMIYADKV